MEKRSIFSIIQKNINHFHISITSFKFWWESESMRERIWIWIFWISFDRRRWFSLVKVINFNFMYHLPYEEEATFICSRIILHIVGRKARREEKNILWYTKGKYEPQFIRILCCYLLTTWRQMRFFFMNNEFFGDEQKKIIYFSILTPVCALDFFNSIEFLFCVVLYTQNSHDS
jgi:hypothetical protein